MSWIDNLQAAQLDGISFPVEDRKVTYSRDGARIRLPYVDGQDVEDTGRNPRTYVLTIPLFPTVEGMSYDEAQEKIERLTDLADGDRSLNAIEYVDPIHGALDVRIWSCAEATNGQERDGARLVIELEELTFDSTGTLVVRRSAERDALEAAREVDDALADSTITEDDAAQAIEQSGYPRTPQERKATSSGALVEGVWNDFRSSMTEAALVVDEAAARVDAVRARVRSVLALPGMGLASNFPLFSSLLVFMDAVSRFGDQAVASAIPVIEEKILGDESVYDVAIRLYGDASRAEEILRRNSIRTPLFIPRGITLRLPQR